MRILTLKKKKLVEWRCLECQHDEKASAISTTG